MDGVMFYLVVAGGAALGLSVTTIVFLVRYRHRWLARGEKVVQGEGAFRRAPAEGAPRVQARRWWLLPVAVSNVLWAVVTLFFLAPAGLLGCGMYLGPVMATGDPGFGLVPVMNAGWEIAQRIFWPTVGIATIDALPLAVLLVAASLMLTSRHRDASRLSRVAGLWSLAHHGALVLVGLLSMVLSPGSDPLGPMTIGLAGVGVLGALATLGAGRLCARGRGELDEDVFVAPARGLSG